MSATGLSRPSNRVLVLFGATGDLAARKLFPGLYHLFEIGLMPEQFKIIGSGRHAPDDIVAVVKAGLEKHSDADLDSDTWKEFSSRLDFVASSADDGSDLAEAVRAAESEIDASGERLVYLSVPPTATEAMVKMLGETGIAENCSLVVEKPFGHDVASAKELNATLHSVLGEEEIYRIDHFLGKEPVQNMLAARFANSILEPVWNRDHINYVQIDVPEAIDIQGRASFYEETGAFRDMVVTHLMQILGVVALEPPSRIDAESLHLERTKVFQALRELDPSEVVYGQYDGYRDSDGVDDESKVETFVALTAWVDDWRWSGVPFYLRTGKALAAGRRTVTIGFKDAPLRIFSSFDPDEHEDVRPTELVFELSDDPKVAVHLLAKVPGPGLRLGAAALKLDIDENFGHDGLEAYARLLHDVMSQDRLLFTQSDQIERLWQVCEPVIEHPPTPLPYEQDSWGPQAALDLPIAPGWRLPDGQ